MGMLICGTSTQSLPSATQDLEPAAIASLALAQGKLPVLNVKWRGWEQAKRR